jgi:hypothetical protein
LQFIEARPHTDPGIVDQRIDASVFGHRLRDQILTLGFHAHIGLHHQRPSATLPTFDRGRLQPIGIPRP